MIDTYNTRISLLQKLLLEGYTRLDACEKVNMSRVYSYNFVNKSGELTKIAKEILEKGHDKWVRDRRAKKIKNKNK